MTVPPYLKKNDKVALIATAKNFDPELLSAGVSRLEEAGLVVVKGRNLFKKFHQFAGNDEERAADLQWALDDPEIRAVFCARGGYGTSRIIDKINFGEFLISPKWVIGFSDLTLLHGTLHNLSCESIHGLMPSAFGKPEYKTSVENLIQTLFGKALVLNAASHFLNRPGNVDAILFGGNLTMLHTMINTTSMPDLKGKILFLEEVGEYLYHVDRMMVHLRRAGILEQLAGLFVGHFSDMKDNVLPFGKSVAEIISDAVSGYNYPLAFGFPSGHEAPNLPLICGRSASFVVDEHGAKIIHSSSEQFS